MPFPASYPNWVFSLFSFIGFALVCIPFPWHFEGISVALGLSAAMNSLTFITSSVEYGNMPLHGLDGCGLPQPVHQFHCMESERHQLGSYLV